MIVGRCAYCAGAVTQLNVTAPAACPCGRVSIPVEFLRDARGIGQVAPAPARRELDVEQLQLQLLTAG